MAWSPIRFAIIQEILRIWATINERVVCLVTNRLPAILNFTGQAKCDVTLAVMTQPMFCLETLLLSWLRTSMVTDRIERRKELLALLLRQIKDLKT